MIIRPLRIIDLSLFLLLSWSTAAKVASEDTFDCRFQVGALKYDLEPLAGEHVVERKRNTPPTREVDSVRISLCSDLKHQEDVLERDQVCPQFSACSIQTDLFQVSCWDACVPHKEQLEGRR
jgi:hypothetical protein